MDRGQKKGEGRQPSPRNGSVIGRQDGIGLLTEGSGRFLRRDLAIEHAVGSVLEGLVHFGNTDRIGSRGLTAKRCGNIQ